MHDTRIKLTEKAVLCVTYDAENDEVSYTHREGEDESRSANDLIYILREADPELDSFWAITKAIDLQVEVAAWIGGILNDADTERGKE